MQNREIYDSALRFLAESTVAGENNDYADRAPYLIAAFCTEMTELDAKIRNTVGESQPVFDAVNIPLDSPFPLSPRLSTAATLYLAAMLILDSDEERSDKLYEQYLAAIQRISDGIPVPEEPKDTDESNEPAIPTPTGPWVSQPTINKYF